MMASTVEREERTIESDRMPYRFTIVTPTYNRANTLARVYESLLRQTLLPAEWIIVDDGSTDETGRVVREWMRTAPFTISYIRQERNTGKPAAQNAGVAAATSELIALLDDDDWLVPHALERLNILWRDIPDSERGLFTGISVNSQFESGEIVGAPFPASPIDSTLLEMRTRGWLKGDKWGFHRRDVIQRFPNPLFEGETYVPDALLWNRIGREFRMRFVNETLLYKTYLAGGITKKWIATCARSARGTKLYYLELAELTPNTADRARAIANAVRYGAHRREFGLPRKLVRRFPVIAACAWVIGSGAWLVDKVRLSQAAAT